MIFLSIEDILTAEHEAIRYTLDSASEETPDDYVIERIRGVHAMVETLLRMKKEGG